MFVGHAEHDLAFSCADDHLWFTDRLITLTCQIYHLDAVEHLHTLLNNDD